MVREKRAREPSRPDLKLTSLAEVRAALPIVAMTLVFFAASCLRGRYASDQERRTELGAAADPANRAG